MADTTNVEDMDSSKNNSPIAGPVEEEATVMLNTAKNTCFWNDQEFQDGAVVSNNGVSYECSLGSWIKK